MQWPRCKLDINLNSIADCSEKYCVGGGSLGTGGDWIVKVKLYNLINTSFQTSYSDFSKKTVELVQGGKYNMEIQLATVFDLDTAFAYIDWNQDTIFQNDEIIKFGNFELNGIAIGEVKVPNTAKLGNARIRARVIYGNNNNYTACGSFFGEVEDYTAKIVPANCPNIGSPCNDGKVCTKNDAIDQNCNCVGTFEDSDSDGVCDDLDICIDSDDNADINENGVPDCLEHCIGIGAYNTGQNYIKSVTIGDAEFKSGRKQYSYTQSPLLNIEANKSYDLIVTINEKTELDMVQAWLDYDDNKIFTEFEKLAFIQYDEENKAYSGFEFTDEAFGKKLLRIRTYGSAAEPGVCDVAIGEVEDYVLNFVDPNGIKEWQLETIQVYPNPTSDLINIESPVLRMSDIILYDLQGKIFLKKKIQSNIESLSLEELNNGVYFLQIATESGPKQVKIFKGE